MCFECKRDKWDAKTKKAYEASMKKPPKYGEGRAHYVKNPKLLAQMLIGGK